MNESEAYWDEWFFNSFRRYHKLQMFGVDKSVVAMELSSKSSACLACKKPDENGFEVLDLELPNKLYQLENEPDSINTNRDLKIKCGTLTDNRLIDMKTIFGKSKIVLSEEGVGKVTIYETNFQKSDQMIPFVNVDCKVDSGRLAIDYKTDTLVVWGKENSWHIGCVFDIENNKETLTFRDECNNPASNLVPYFMSKNELIVLNSEYGSFDLYDLTSGKLIENISSPGILILMCKNFKNLDTFFFSEVNNCSKWFSNTMYTSFKETNVFNLTLISNSGTLLTYDLRSCKVPKIYHKELFSECNNDININIDPCDSNKSSVSGFDGNVYIIEESNNSANMLLEFKHEGHLYTENEEDFSKSKITTSTLWLPMCGSNTLLSAANDGSIQGWQYI